MKKFFAVLGLFLWAGNLFAEGDDITLDTIVVTPYRYEEELARTPETITVVTQEDIKDSNAESVVDAIRSVPGVVVRDWTGNATKASVDIRGFGEQSGMNVLVLVDGRRINETDLSAVDWTQIPLDHVKSIEIIRGGNSVLYGDNATGGVINIITEKGIGPAQFELGTEVGSYDSNSQKLTASGSKKNCAYWFSASRQNANGYRSNSFYKSRDFATNLEYQPKTDLSLRFSSGYHHASFGFPGALSGSDIENFGRRYSKFGDDRATEADYYFVAGIDKEFGSLGAFDMDASFRRKKVNTNFIGANAGWNPLLFSRIDTYGLTPKYKLDTSIFKMPHKFLAGLDIYRYDYGADSYSSSNALQQTNDINKYTLGGYVQDEATIFKNLVATGGFRYEGAKYEFAFHDNSGWNPDINSDITPNEKAYNGGLIYNYKEGSNVFLNLNQSFRFPATDEYFTWGALNTALKPQESRNYELGVRHRFNEKLSVTLSAFRMNIRNELYYNPLGGPFGFGANENYDKTRHQGVEFAFESKPHARVGFFGNYSYLEATFNDGLYDGKDIPMVPRHKGSLGLKFLLPKNITLNVQGNYVGKRYFINDQANALSRLNEYVTADMNVAYTYKECTVTAGVSNLFDREYSEFGVCNNITGAKNYYPNPGRTFSLKLDYKF